MDDEILLHDEDERRDYKRYSRQERLEMIDRMLEQKYRSQSSWEEIADSHGVARSTIRRWRMSDEWRVAEARWRRVMREEARSDVALIGHDMIGVLQDLAHNSRSDFTRYSAASKLLDLFGVGDELEESKVDQAGELMKFVAKMKEKEIENRRLVDAGIDPGNILEAEVKPGGLLPDVIVARNREIMESTLAERDELEEEMD